MPEYANPYSFDHRANRDGTVTFRCSSERQANPWLALPPHHPVVIQTQGFWTAIGAMMTLGGMEAGQWSALTWIDWELGDANGGHGVRGVYSHDDSGENRAYKIVLYNGDDAPIVTIQGRGVVFRNRNFEEWRKGAKTEAKRSAPVADFTFARPDALGLSRQERVLVAPFKHSGGFEEGAGFVEALVTPENGLPPGNPFIGGSGDHVNSTHLHELARQALFLIKGRSDIDTSGEMTMKRYVELGTPLRLTIAANEAQMARFEIEQLGKACSEIELRW